MKNRSVAQVRRTLKDQLLRDAVADGLVQDPQLARQRLTIEQLSALRRQNDGEQE